MRTSSKLHLSLAVVMSLGITGFAGPIAAADDTNAQATYRDIEKTLGTVPGFFKNPRRGQKRPAL